VSVPESVRKAAEQANQYIVAQNTAAATLPDDGKKPTETPEPEPNQPAPTSVKPEPTENKTEGFQPLDKPLGEDDVKWESRYKILQGKYNAEVPKLQNQIKELTEQAAKSTPVDQTQVTTLQAEVARLTQELKSKPAQKPTAPSSDQEKRLRDELGDDVFDFMEQKYGARLNQVDQIAQQVNQVDQKVTTSTQENTTEVRKGLMRNRLTAKNVDFDGRNRDPLFIDFINSRAENGVALSVVLGNAFNSGDLDKAEEIFLAYDAPTTPTAPASSAPDLTQHVQVSPSSVHTDAAPQVEQWTDEQIKSFYRDKAIPGKISPEDAARYEKSLFAFLSSQQS